MSSSIASPRASSVRAVPKRRPREALPLKADPGINRASG
jgi:hypothetical protein